jgi:hypothetical protein
LRVGGLNQITPELTFEFINIFLLHVFLSFRANNPATLSLEARHESIAFTRSGRNQWESSLNLKWSASVQFEGQLVRRCAPYLVQTPRIARQQIMAELRRRC